MEVSGDLTTTHSVFTPGSAPSTLAMDTNNDDLSAGGVLVLPPQNLGGNYFAVAAGKDGRLFLFERKGTADPATAADLQWINTYTNGNLLDGCWCGPSYFMGSDGISRVVTSHGNMFQVFTVTVSPPALTLVGTSATTVGLGGQQDPGFFTTVSSNGTTAGSAIIWAVSRPDGSIPSNPTAVKLYAFSATPSCTGTTCTYPQLYSGVAGAWPFANNNSNIVPVVANGQVYVASDYFDASGTLRGQLNIFGIPAAAPAALAKQAAKPLEGRQIPSSKQPPQHHRETCGGQRLNAYLANARAQKPNGRRFSSDEEGAVWGSSESGHSLQRRRIHDRGKRRAACGQDYPGEG